MIKKSSLHGETLCKICQNGWEVAPTFWWMKKVHPLRTQQPIFQNHVAQFPYQEMVQGATTRFTHFPKNPKCEACKWTKISAERFGDLDYGRPQDPQRRGRIAQQTLVCGCCAEFGYAVDLQLAMQFKDLTRNDEKLREVPFLDLNSSPNVIYAEHSMEFGEVCE